MSLSNVDKSKIKFENDRAYYKQEHFSSRAKEEVGDLVKIYSYDDGYLDGLYLVYNKATHRYKEIGSYLNGKQHGTYKQYFDNGVLADDSYFFKGGRDGITKIYYENGKLRGVINYVNGKKEGHATQFYVNGKTMFDHNYHLDKMNGICTDYYKNGNKKSVITYIDGVQQGKYSLFHTNGALKEMGSVVHDKKNGPFAIYDEKQKQIIVGRFVDGLLDGKITYTLANDWKEVREFKNGIQDGLVETFDEKGNKRGVMNFVSGIAHGDYVSFDENGNILKKGFLDNKKALEQMLKEKEAKEKAKKEALLKEKREREEQSKTEIILDVAPEVLSRSDNALSNTLRVHTASPYNKKDNESEDTSSSTIDINQDNIVLDNAKETDNNGITLQDIDSNILNTEVIHEQAKDGNDVLQVAPTPDGVKLDSVQDVRLSSPDVEITLDGSYLNEDGVSNMLNDSQTQTRDDKYKSLNINEDTKDEASESVMDINITN